MVVAARRISAHRAGTSARAAASAAQPRRRPPASRRWASGRREQPGHRGAHTVPGPVTERGDGRGERRDVEQRAAARRCPVPGGTDTNASNGVSAQSSSGLPCGSRYRRAARRAGRRGPARRRSPPPPARATGWTCSDSGAAAASSLTMNGRRGPNRSTTTGRRARRAGRAAMAASSGPSGGLARVVGMRAEPQLGQRFAGDRHAGQPSGSAATSTPGVAPRPGRSAAITAASPATGARCAVRGRGRARGRSPARPAPRRAPAARRRRSRRRPAPDVAPGGHGELRADQQLLRAEVHRAQVDDPVHPAVRPAEQPVGDQRAAPLAWRPRRAAGSSSRPPARSRPRRAVRRWPGCRSRPTPAGRAARRHPDADQREGQTDQRRGVLEQDDREVRHLGSPDERHPAVCALELAGLGDRGPQGEGLQRDRHQQDDERDGRGCRGGAGGGSSSRPRTARTGHRR